MPSVIPHRLQLQVTLGPGDCVPYTEAKADGGTSCDWQCYATLVLLNGTAVSAPRARRPTAWPRPREAVQGVMRARAGGRTGSPTRCFCALQFACMARIRLEGHVTQ